MRRLPSAYGEVENDRLPILASSEAPVHPRVAEAAIKQARAHSGVVNDRIEFCRAFGVHYWRALVYVPIVDALERSLTTTPVTIPDNLLRRPTRPRPRPGCARCAGTQGLECGSRCSFCSL